MQASMTRPRATALQNPSRAQTPHTPRLALHAGPLKVATISKQTIKEDILDSVAQLGASAILPGRDEEKARIDSLVQQLQDGQSWPPSGQEGDLYGSWQLVYASQGTVVTRTSAGSALITLGTQLPGVGINNITQRISRDDTGRILVNNEAEFGLGPFGSWQVAIEGEWRSEAPGDIQKVQVVFDKFRIKPVGWLGVGLPDWLPPLLFSVGSQEVARTGALWLTPYLDQDIRVGMGKSGNVFLFRRVQ